MKEMKVDAIRNGTVIDHIPAGKAWKVVEILKIHDSPLLVGVNLSSRKCGRKDLIKIEEHELSADEANSIALIAPQASISIIRDYEIAEKIAVTIPESITAMIVCPNPGCITNVEKIPTRFATTRLKGTAAEGIGVRCAYCEKRYNVADVRIRI
jgi:aspartate carbamoyltransferase regulatory subunit